jgi:hypothetical protein
MAEPLTWADALFLLVDHQTGAFERLVTSPPCEEVETNVLRLADSRRSACRRIGRELCVIVVLISLRGELTALHGYRESA